MRKLLVVLAVALFTTGCGIVYRQPIYQGVLLEKSAVDQLQAGMDKQQTAKVKRQKGKVKGKKLKVKWCGHDAPAVFHVSRADDAT